MPTNNNLHEDVAAKQIIGMNDMTFMVATLILFAYAIFIVAVLKIVSINKPKQ
jgi:hypothetical protein